MSDEEQINENAPAERPGEPKAEQPEDAAGTPAPDPEPDPASPAGDASGDASGDTAGAAEGDDPEISDEAAAALKAAQDAVAEVMGDELSDASESDESAMKSAEEAAAEAEMAAMLASSERGTPAGGRSIGATLPPDGEPAPMNLPAFDRVSPAELAEEMNLLGDVNVDVRIELGRTRMLVEDVLRLSEGAVVELEKLAGDPVDIFVNGRHVAKGEVLVLNENFCVRVNEVVEPLPVSETS